MHTSKWLTETELFLEMYVLQLADILENFFMKRDKIRQNQSTV